MTYNYKTPTRRHRGKLYDIELGNDFLEMMSRAQATKAKLDKWNYIEQTLLYIKGQNQQSKKGAYGMRENSCKSYI